MWRVERWVARVVVWLRWGVRGEGCREGWVCAREGRRGCGAVGVEVEGAGERRGWSWVVLWEGG